MDSIFELAKELNKLYETTYNLIAPDIEKIIRSKNRDIHLIEAYLDKLLDIPTDKAYNLLVRLCNYCMNIDKDIAEFYLNEYEELYEIEKPKIKKKT